MISNILENNAVIVPLMYEAKKANAWPVLAWKEKNKWVTLIQNASS